jgi:hypothetical protein
MAEFRIPDLNAADTRLAGSVFEFVQFLLDDDANLTPAGNLTGGARQKLRDRLQELIAAETASSDTEAVAAQNDQATAETGSVEAKP